MRGKLALVCGCVLTLGSVASAASLLDDTPTLLAAWQTPVGYVSVAGDKFAPLSPGVGNRLLLSTGTNDDGDAPSTAAVEGSLGLDGGTLAKAGGHVGFDVPGGPVEGSAVRRSFTARPGDTLTISFDFLTAEGSAAYSKLSPIQLKDLPPKNVDDFAFLVITHAGADPLIARLADVLTPGLTDALDLTNGQFLYHTGFRTFQLALPAGPDVTDGAYAIALGVMDGRALTDERGHIIESALLVQSITVAGPAPVPLPAAAPAGLALLGGCAAFRRRVRRDPR